MTNRDDLSPEGFVWHLLRRVRFLSDDHGPAGSKLHLYLGAATLVSLDDTAVFQLGEPFLTFVSGYRELLEAEASDILKRPVSIDFRPPGDEGQPAKRRPLPPPPETHSAAW